MPDPKPNQKRISAYAKGWMGEDAACAYLQNKGMILLSRRYRSLFGEIDLVMQDGETLVFVEVKARAKARPGTGLYAITPAKQKRMLKAAALYLAEHDCNSPARFDAVEVTASGILHIPGAFDATDAEW